MEQLLGKLKKHAEAGELGMDLKQLSLCLQTEPKLGWLVSAMLGASYASGDVNKFTLGALGPLGKLASLSDEARGRLSKGSMEVFAIKGRHEFIAACVEAWEKFLEEVK